MNFAFADGVGNLILPSLSQEVKERLTEISKSISSKCQQVCSSRKALQKAKIIKEIKQFNPRFEEDFAQEKDYDVDR